MLLNRQGVQEDKYFDLLTAAILDRGAFLDKAVGGGSPLAPAAPAGQSSRWIEAGNLPEIRSSMAS